MKKKLLALILSTAMVLSLAGCGSKAALAADDLVFAGSEDDVKLKVDNILYMEEDWTGWVDLNTGNYEEFYEEFVSARGLEVGMTLSDYKNLYAVKRGYAVWELIDGGYTSFDEYTNQSASDMYKDADDVWLDLGWCKDGDKWRAMTDVEVQDTWFCDADLDAFDEIVFFSVGLDKNDKIQFIYVYYITYDEYWVALQGWQ